jgi:hypothetical protein
LHGAEKNRAEKIKALLNLISPEVHLAHSPLPHHFVADFKIFSLALLPNVANTMRPGRPARAHYFFLPAGVSFFTKARPPTAAIKRQPKE